LKIEGVEFAWPVESELTVDASNRVHEKLHAVSFSVAPVALDEFKDSTALAGAKIRLLRNAEGYYFLTGARFKNVYVLTPGEGTLTLKTRIAVSETGLSNPALNQRPPYVQLLDGSAPARLLSSDDLVEEHK
jgi:hypothetical protein